MDINNLIDNRKTKEKEQRDLFAVIETEKRKFSEEEEVKLKTLKSEIENIDKEITKRKKNENKKMEKFNLLKAINLKVNNRGLDDVTSMVIDEGIKEMRNAGINPEGDIVLPLEIRGDILAGTDTQGSETIAETKASLLGPLRERLVLTQAGANYITGMVNNFSIPTYGGTSASWKGEVSGATDGAGTFGEVEFSPKRLTTYVDVSKQFLTQNSTDAENLLKQDIVDAVVAKLESTILGATSGATQPTGIFETPAFTGTTTWDNIVLLETNVDSGNALFGNMGYITSAAGRGKLKSTEVASTTGRFILEGSEMNGYPVYTTNHTYNVVSGDTVTSFGIAFANWSDLIIVQWGNTDIVVDGITLAKDGKVRLVINTYWDAKFRRTASVSTATLAV